MNNAYTRLLALRKNASDYISRERGDSRAGRGCAACSLAAAGEAGAKGGQRVECRTTICLFPFLPPSWGLELEKGRTSFTALPPRAFHLSRTYVRRGDSSGGCCGVARPRISSLSFLPLLLPLLYSATSPRRLLFEPIYSALAGREG